MNTNRLVRWLIVVALAGSSAAWATNPSSTNYAIKTDVMNAGVGPMGSTNYQLSSSLGGAFATAPIFSTNYRLGFGLWPSGPSVAAAILQSAYSRKHHGVAGDFDLALSLLASNPTVEPRQGPTATIVLRFDKPVTSAAVAVTEGTAAYGGLTTSGNDAILSFSGVTNAQYVTISATNVASADGGTGGTGSVRLGFLAGDVNGSRNVTLADVLSVNSSLAQQVSVSNFLRDVNLSGTLSLADKLFVNSNLSKFLPAP